GFTRLLKPHGVATFEFPHLMQLVQNAQFDTIYHEHFSYLSLTSVSTIFEANGLQVFDVEELPTHGGSLRVYAQRRDTGTQHISQALMSLLAREQRAGIATKDYYEGFQTRADKIKNDLLEFLIAARNSGKTIMAYG